MKRFLHWIRDYVRTYVSSLSDIRFYRGVVHKRPAEAVGHLAVAIVLLWMIPFLVTFFIGAKGALRAFNESLRTHVPAGTAFEVKKGVFINTLEEPIVIRDGKTVFIVNTASSTLAFEDDEIGVILDSEAIVQKRSEGTIQTTMWKSVPDTRVTKEGVESWVRSNAKWIILLTAVLLTIIVFASLSVGYAFLTLFHAFLLWFLFRMRKRPLPYGQAYVLAAYAAGLPILVTAATYWLDVDASMIPTVLYWILLGIIAFDRLKHQPAAVSHQPSETEPKTPAPQDPPA